MGTHTASSRGTTGLIVQRLLQVAFGVLLQAVVFFLASGRPGWVMAWAYFGVYLGIVVVNVLVLLPRSPDLIAERAQVKADTKGWDRPLAMIVSLGPLVTLLVAGLDVRLSWSGRLSLALELVALACMALGYGLWGWAMAANRFFSGLVRIQKERGHTVATGGPYRFVRHPGYAGLITYSLATPLLLGSLWGLIPAVMIVCVAIVRTALEDRTLAEELAGYRDYAERVRYRLLPGVW